MTERPIQVLIVEDNPGDARLVRTLLSEASSTRLTSSAFTVTWVERLDEALVVLTHQAVDVILLDLSLPDSQGLATVTRMVAAAPQTPIIVLSGLVDELVAIQAVHTGAQDYLLKGQIDEQLIVRAIRYAIERNRIEAALRGHERHFRALIEHSADGIALIDESGTIVYESPSAARIVGYAADELIGRNLRDFVQPEELPRVTEWIDAMLRQPGVNVEGESRYRHKNGEYRWIDVVGTNLLADPNVRAIVINYRDITHRKQAEEALRQSQQRVESILTSVSDTHILFDRHWHYLYVNEAAANSIGLPREQILGRTLWEVFPDIIGTELERQYRRAMEQRISVSFAFHYPGRDTWWENRFFPAPEGLAIFATEITARKQAELKSAQLAAIVDQAAETILLTDLDGKIVYANPFFTRLTGYTLDEVLGQNPRLLKSGHMDPAIYQQLWATLKAGNTWTGQLINRRKNGRLYREEATMFPIKDQAGRIISYAAVKRDVTEQQQQEREMQAIAIVATALRAAPGRAEMIPAILHQIVSIMGLDGAALALKQSPGGGIIISLGVGTWSYWTGRRLPPGAGHTGRVMDTGQPFIELDTARVGQEDMEDLGSLRSVICVPLIEEGRAFGALWIGHEAPDGFINEELRWLTAIADIAANALYRATVLETLEQRVHDRTRELAEANTRLQDLDRLKSKFVSDVSHELRTPITSLKLNVDLLAHGKPEKRDRYLSVINDQTDRLIKLVNDILNLSRLEMGAPNAEFVSVNLNELVAHTVQVLESAATLAGLVLAFDPAPDLPPIRGEPNQIAQVISNLVANAIHYTSAGRVQITTRLSDDLACLEVSDTGMGIQPADLPHLFERFYRGKQSSDRPRVPGTGLGLAIVKEIVDLHGGRIEVQSTVGAGSTFSVYLPLAATPSDR